MSTSPPPVKTGTRSLIDRTRTSLAVNVPKPGCQVLKVETGETVILELQRDDDRVTWFFDRSLQDHNGSTYIIIPADVVDMFDLTAADSLSVTVHADRVEYRLDDRHSLVIHRDGVFDARK